MVHTCVRVYILVTWQKGLRQQYLVKFEPVVLEAPLIELDMTLLSKSRPDVLGPQRLPSLLKRGGFIRGIA